MIQGKGPQPGRGTLPGKRLRKIRKETIRLAREPALNFFELAGLIADLNAADPAEIRDLPQEAKMSRRRLYYLLDVGRFIRKSTITKVAAERIGWTKLQIIARHYYSQDEAKGREIGPLLSLAGSTTARALAEVLTGERPVPRRLVAFYLDHETKTALEEALIQFGASHNKMGWGLLGKEEALKQLVKAATESLS